MIDAHVHCWQINQRNCVWPGSDLLAIYRDFLPHDWRAQSRDLGISRGLLVQTQENVSDTRWLLELAQEHDYICGVVGWVDLSSPDLTSTLKDLTAAQKNGNKKSPQKKLCGVRPMLQSMPDDRWVLKPEVARGIETLIEFNLTFDALIFPRHIPVISKLATRYPELKIIVDHAAKPQIAAEDFRAWSKLMTALIPADNVWIKWSGLATEMSELQAWDQVQPYWNFVADRFGGERIIWGSDWPVLQLAENPNLATYREAFHSAWSLVVHSGFDVKAVFERNAEQAYSL